jgi:hypothetical protein
MLAAMRFTVIRASRRGAKPSSKNILIVARYRLL